MDILPDKYFKNSFWVAKSYTAVASVTSWAFDILRIDISQSTVATRLVCGGVFKYDLVTKFPDESNGERILKIG